MKNVIVKAFGFSVLLLMPVLSQAEVFVIVNEGVSDTVVSVDCRKRL